MAKINNQEIMQKLIDELELYPAKDVIPTELAEKILPTFQVNSSELTVSVPKSNILKSGVGTIYTVPATGKFFLCNAYCSGDMDNSTVNGTGYARLSVTPKDGSATVILEVQSSSNANGNNGASSNSSLNLQNPIELEPGSIISQADNIDFGFASIVGYTE